MVKNLFKSQKIKLFYNIVQIWLIRYSSFNKIVRPLILIIKKLINLIIKECDPTTNAVKNNEIKNSDIDRKANKTNKILAKSKNINKLLKVKKFAKA